MKWLTQPHVMRRVWGASTISVIVLWPVAHFTGWIYSVVFVNELSLAALVAGFGSGWLAARIEDERQRENMPKEVVEAMLEKTNVEKQNAPE